MAVNRARVLRRFGLVDVPYKITAGFDALGLPWIRFENPDQPPRLFDLLGANRLAATLRAIGDHETADQVEAALGALAPRTSVPPNRLIDNR
jgi:hypothetical protein